MAIWVKFIACDVDLGRDVAIKFAIITK